MSDATPRPLLGQGSTGQACTPYLLSLAQRRQPEGLLSEKGQLGNGRLSSVMSDRKILMQSQLELRKSAYSKRGAVITTQ